MGAMTEQGMLTEQVSRQNTLMTDQVSRQNTLMREQGDGRTGDVDRSAIQTEQTH